MKTKNQTNIPARRNHITRAVSVLAVLSLTTLLVVSCGHNSESQNKNSGAERMAPINPLAVILAPQPGEDSVAKKILRLQEQIRTNQNNSTAIEQLGWQFIAKARVSFDPGFYKLAEQCGIALGLVQPHSPEALLLRGHALQNLHHFKDAEPLARELVARRGRAFDYGLLGDVLMEQGRLDEAVAAYQQMADIKPDLHAYTRAAHMRWLKGDLDGAIEVMQLAVQAASPRAAESAAWVCTRMAMYQLQAGDLEKCRHYCDAALEFQTNYPPALLARGRLLLAKEKFSEALEPLALAAKLNPLPEYQWALAEALRAANRASEAEAVEHELNSRGASADPRSYALFLATRGENVSTALELAEAELQTRADVFTHDTLACSLAANNRWSDAEKETQLALREGTQDARLFLHAGIVAAHLAKTQEAESLFQKAAALRQMLLPSERRQLERRTGVAPVSNLKFSLNGNGRDTGPTARTE